MESHPEGTIFTVEELTEGLQDAFLGEAPRILLLSMQGKDVLFDLQTDTVRLADKESRRKARRARAEYRDTLDYSQEVSEYITEVVARRSFKRFIYLEDVAAQFGLTNTGAREHLNELVMKGELKDIGGGFYIPTVLFKDEEPIVEYL